jgi:hypothetical protein
MIRRVILISVAMACLAPLGCGTEERPKAEPQPRRLPHTTEAGDNNQPAPTADEFPVPEDFEAEAEREITRDNLRSELDSLDREISADKPKPPDR